MIEKLVLVDENDNPSGIEEKWACHEGSGKLHRAFSLWIFTTEGKILLQKRSKKKTLWPLYWSNSCCSHPRQNESYEDAATRRTPEEIGLEIKPVMLDKFQYRSQYQTNGQLIGTEHEICALLYAVTNKKPNPNQEEIRLTRYLTMKDILEEVRQHPEEYTPWFKKEIPLIQQYLQSKLIITKR